MLIQKKGRQGLQPLRFVRYLLMIYLFSVLLSTNSGFASAGETFKAEPRLRLPSYMPPMTRESGYCCMSYDIDKYGKTKNVTAIYCSNEIFAQPSIRAVSKWTYYPKMVNGVDVETRNKVTYHSYFLTNEAGNHIKNQDGYPNFDKNGKHLSEHICAEFIV